MPGIPFRPRRRFGLGAAGGGKGLCRLPQEVRPPRPFQRLAGLGIAFLGLWQFGHFAQHHVKPLRACARGVKLFDYGRSKRGTGSFAFKKNWGFEPQPLHYEYRLYKRDAVPQNNPANRKFSVLIEAWRRMPRGVACAVGPLVVRGLG